MKSFNILSFFIITCFHFPINFKNFLYPLELANFLLLDLNHSTVLLYFRVIFIHPIGLALSIASNIINNMVTHVKIEKNKLIFIKIHVS